ncbi:MULTISPECIES: class C beta-lactamase [unclassified Shewanella]|uniref:class C beta-lactamase n=1 Tax=Shewanella TaxID=22 RepID=UPI0021D89B38|nr:MULTISPECIES: class C beta-lactamase [unclassified Shewanella]MCU8021447.1 beta-lactamase [Shewanella sp. SM78]MCU8041733.1 beta-lactamase [Shewanella sp. SM68]MCU8046597.1 beta-lactamase [Shewanella sp. SM65]MCU8078644.1 beta-lactamase [Shewanella sp. SM103]
MHPKAPIASIPLLSGVLLTATLFSNVTTAQTLNTKDIQSIVDSAVKPLMAEYAIPGAVIGITIEGKQYFYQYGVSSKTSGQSVTEDTLFEIGSISKTFTATLANYAQGEGKLTLTDMASDYVPALKGSHFDKISLINLATHTAGDLPMQVPDKVTNNAELMDYLKHWQPSFAAGTHRNYANPSIGLLGMIAAQSLGQTFPQVLEQTLFPQLGMTNSYLKVPSNKMADYAQGYDKQDMPVRVNPGVLADEAYGVKTSAKDLLQFVEANMQMHPLTKPLQTALDETHTGYFDVGMMTQDMIWEHYSYPIDLNNLLAGHTQEVVFGSTPVKPIVPPLAPQQNVWINKTGSTGGFAAYAAFIPAKKLGIVLLSNKNTPVPPRVTVGYQILTGIEKLQK